MKVLYYLLILNLIIVLWICQSCRMNTKKCLAVQLYNDNRETIIETFSSHSIFQRGELVILIHHKEELENKYFFSKSTHQIDDQFSLTFLRDSLEFEPLFQITSNNRLNNSDNFKKEIEEYAAGLLTKMDSLGIAELSSEFAKFGIDLKVSLKDKSVLIFVSHYNKIRNREWISYINRAKKLDSNWYYYEPEEEY